MFCLHLTLYAVSCLQVGGCCNVQHPLVFSMLGSGWLGWATPTAFLASNLCFCHSPTWSVQVEDTQHQETHRHSATQMRSQKVAWNTSSIPKVLPYNRELYLSSECLVHASPYCRCIWDSRQLYMSVAPVVPAYPRNTFQSSRQESITINRSTSSVTDLG